MISEQQIDEEVLQSLLDQIATERLESISPREAMDMYLNHREGELASSTLKTHESRLRQFIQFCDENAINNLNDLTGRNIQDYRTSRQEGLTMSSLKSNMRTLRTFLNICVKFDAVRSDIPEKVDIPTLERNEKARSVVISSERATEIVSHLAKYHYASSEHVTWILLAGTGMRLGSIRALDIKDYESTEKGGILLLVHRPESGTPLKNKKESERQIHVGYSISQVIDDFIDDQRPKTTDEFGRKPLLATEEGRIHETTIRKYVYKWSRSCAISGECPHEYEATEIEDCVAARHPSKAYKCPSSSSPHSIRRGYITHELGADVPDYIVSDRCDVSPEIIKQHYDERDEGEKMIQRREIRESIYKGNSGGEYFDESSKGN